MTEREDQLAKAAQDFIDKVDRGAARSEQSYAAFKTALAAPQALAATPAVGGEALRDAIMGAARLYTHDHTTAYKIAETAMATLAAPPASPFRGREDEDGADDLEHLDGMLDDRSRES